VNTATYAERYFSSERVSVIDDWQTVIAVPAVHFDTPTTTQQHLIHASIIKHAVKPVASGEIKLE